MKTRGVAAERRNVETPSAFGELSTLTATESAGPSTLYTLDVADRDALGRIETKSETIAGATTTNAYTYGTAGRLETVTTTPQGGSPTTVTYGYDANGNRTHVDNTLVGVYDDQDRLTSYAGTTYTYTAAGDLDAKVDGSGTTDYDYDALGNLRAVLLPSGMRIEYVIDGQNRRVGKKICAAPCTSPAVPQLQQGFLYADQLRIVAELDGSNDVVSRFVYGIRTNVPDYMVKGGTTYRILSDQVGSVRLVVNAGTGAVVQRIDYDAFGNPTYVTGAPDFQPFGFAGGLTDLDTGLVRFGARDYEPRVGRWTSKDPIRFQGNDPGLYGYVASDPVNYIDPTGTITPLAGAALGAAIGGIGTFAFAYASGADLPVAFAAATFGAAYGALGGAAPTFGLGAAVGAIGGAATAAAGGASVGGVAAAATAGAATGALAGLPGGGLIAIGTSAFTGAVSGAALSLLGDGLCGCPQEAEAAR